MSGRVRRSIETLPSRFKGSTISARYRLSIDDESCEVVMSPDACHVEPCWGRPDVEICTDRSTWHAIDGGRLSGLEAFADRRLVVHGSIEKSLHFEPAFERPDRGGVRYSLEHVQVGRARVSTLTAGGADDEPLLLIHGLGATKASWLTILPALSRRYRVTAIDLPGFGASSKPNASYNAAWFAEHAFGLLDALGQERTLLAGNSMGGRIAMEMAMQRPERVRGIACLCPVAAFSRRPALQLARLARPELTLLAPRLPRGQVMSGLKHLFARPSRLHESWYDAAVDDFLNVWRSPGARVAFARSLRNIYLDEPLGEAGLWKRLSKMETPALYVYGERDALITHHFSHKMRRAVPHAQVDVWPDCGHVPQIEHPERTLETMMAFFGEISAADPRSLPVAATR